MPCRFVMRVNCINGSSQGRLFRLTCVKQSEVAYAPQDMRPIDNELSAPLACQGGSSSLK